MLNNQLTKILFIIGFLVIAGLVVTYFFVKKPSVEAGISRVAIIDSVRIKTQSLPFIKVRQLLEEQHATAQKEILEQESVIREQYEELKKNSVPNSEKQKTKQVLDKKVAELQQSVQKRQEKLTKQFSFLTENLETKLNEIIKEIAREFGFNLVLNTTIQETHAILYAEPSLDVTDEVIKRLDHKLPNLTLPTLEG
ncbi:MAG: OmpH family outer membrane protein [Alphaproteobacteria bacterium]|nr:OmpH family outer membrane protein [Alphaproteobacteria bacterium]